MVQIVIDLTAQQARVIERIAAVREISKPAVIQEMLDHQLGDAADRSTRWQRALSVAGKFWDREGATDVAENHDAHLADMIEDRPQ